MTHHRRAQKIEVVSALDRHELCAIVDGTTLAVCRNPAEDTLYPHPDLCFLRGTCDLGGESRPLIELDYSQDVWSGVLELIACRSDDRVGHDRPLPSEPVVYNLAAPPAFGTE